MPRILNVEIKARCADPSRVIRILEAEGARLVGEDRQVDTYFHCPEGRLKHRRGTIENALVRYRRGDRPGPKRADITLARLPAGNDVDGLLEETLGVWAVVTKVRAIWFLDNLKIHVDRVEGLGGFLEIEAIDETGKLGEARLHAQCEQCMALLGVEEGDLVSGSYSDLIAAAGP